MCLIRTLVTGFRAYLGSPGSSHLKIFNLITSAKNVFQNKVTFTGSEIWCGYLSGARSLAKRAWEERGEDLRDYLAAELIKWMCEVRERSTRIYQHF